MGPGPIRPLDLPRSSAQERVASLRILLVEDHPVNQLMAVRILEGMGHKVVVAGDGRKALEVLDREGRKSFDLALTDLQMPEMDGFETLKAIRRREREAEPTEHGPRLPIVALTAHALSVDRERCMAAGFDGYLSKPIRSRELEAILAAYYPRVRAGCTKVLTTPPAQGDDRPQADSFQDQWDRLLVACGNDQDFAAELAGLYLKTAPRLIDGINDALRSGDTAHLVSDAHGLRGISQSIGAVRMAETSEALESAGRSGKTTDVLRLVSQLQEHWETLRPELLGRTNSANQPIGSSVE